MKGARMDTRLKHAVAVGRYGSFSKAGAAVGVTQSAVTKSVADLEQQIGYAIFHRTSRGVIVTEDGRDFLDRAARLLSDSNDLMNNRRHVDDPFKGVVRVGVYPGSLEWMLTGSLAELVRRHSSVRIEINTGTSERGLQLLNRGDIDAAFGMVAAFGNWKDVDCTQLAELRTHCFVRRGHPLLERQSVTLDDVAEFEIVSPSVSAPYTDVAREIYESRGIDPAGKIHIVDHFPLVREIVAHSDAMGGIADSTTRTPAFERDFVVIKDLEIFPSVGVGLATRAKWPAKPAIKFLKSLLAARLADHQREHLSDPMPA